MIENGTYLSAEEAQQWAALQEARAGQEIPAPVPRMAYPAAESPTAAEEPMPTQTDDDEIHPERIRAELEHYGIVDGELVDEEALRQSPFIQLVEETTSAIQEQNRQDDTEEVEAEDPAQEEPLPDEATAPEEPDKDTDAATVPVAEAAPDEPPALRELVFDLTGNAPPVDRPAPRYQYDLVPGDTAYLDGQPFVVDRVGLFDVSFRNEAIGIPIFRSESKERLEVLLPRDERNLSLRLDQRRMPEPEQATVAEVPEAAPASPALAAVSTAMTEPERRLADEADLTEAPAPGQNFRITDDHLGEGGQKTKYENNVRAIRTLKTLEKENRPASPEDQEVLSQYVGWGGIPQAFDERNAAWADEYRELKALLTPEEYEMARASTLNAHYTSPTVIRAIYQAVEQMGFQSGNILEPSCGVGNFFGLLPESMAGSQLYGVELDSITGRIAQDRKSVV